MRYGKKSCIKRALTLINDGTDASLRYACLELRCCIEAICYELANLYKNQLSENDLKVWQPKKLINILLEVDPFVNESYELRISYENDDGSMRDPAFIGNYKALPAFVLKKHYNKLGSFLHVPTISQRKEISFHQEGRNLKKYLESLIKTLDQSANSTCVSNFAVTVSYYCQKCGEFLIRNIESLKKNSLVICPNQNCKAEYDVSFDKEKSEWQLRQLNIKCPECNTVNFFDRHLLSEKTTITCCECHQKYIFSQKWHFAKENEN